MTSARTLARATTMDTTTRGPWLGLLGVTIFALTVLLGKRTSIPTHTPRKT